MGRKEGANGGVVEFFPVVSLKSMYGATELGGNIGIKRGESGCQTFCREEKSKQNGSNHQEEQDNIETQNY
jgi:hypothetical protein